jgi:glucan-binding YG repeat protein
MPKTSDWFPQSVNWINVMGHIRHFKEYGTFLTASNANVSVGNPVYYDWNGNGTYDHTALCVGKNSSGMPVVDGHTSNVYHVPWSMGSRGKRGTIVLRKSSASNRNNNSSAAKTTAKNVWHTVGDKVYYIGSDGRYVKNRFLTIGGGRYYFNAKGERVTGFFKVGTKWYYASVKNGKLLKGFQNIGGKIYYFYKTDYSRITGGMHKIGNSTYYFNSKGVRQTSFIQVGTKWYYADKSGVVYNNRWLNYKGAWYYFEHGMICDKTGYMIDGKLYDFDSDGKCLNPDSGRIIVTN